MHCLESPIRGGQARLSGWDGAVEHEHFPPRPLTKAGGRGGKIRGSGAVEWLRFWDAKSRCFAVRRTGLFSLAQGRATRRATIKNELFLFFALAKVLVTELAEESPCARMRINPRREDWRPRASLLGSNGILRAKAIPGMNKHEREHRPQGLRKADQSGR